MPILKNRSPLLGFSNIKVKRKTDIVTILYANEMIRLRCDMDHEQGYLTGQLSLKSVQRFARD